MDLSLVNETGKTLQQVPCCVCGSMIIPNEACMCAVCLQRETSMKNCKEDVNELFQCKSCERWCAHIGKESWVHHAYESAGLLALCLKKLGALSKAKILDAAWIWTEPHSKRLKLYVDIEKAVLDGKMNVQQRIVAEFVLKNKMCSDCMRSESDHSWGAMIQLRQRINHQRSLVVLEAQLTKAGMHNLMIGVESSKQGMDFFFKQRNQAEKVVNFISTHFPTKSKLSKRHISTDARTSKPRYELTYAVDLVPLGRGDLVLMPVNLNAKNSSAGEIVMVSKVASSLHLINPITLKQDELIASRFFSKEKLIRVLMSPADLVRFVIMDIEPIEQSNFSPDAMGSAKIKESGGLLADAEVMRESDLGCNDTTYHVRTHLGHLLKPGDIALGYDMVRFASSSEIDSANVHVPDVILVKKGSEGGEKKHAKKKKTRRRKHQKPDEAVQGSNGLDLTTASNEEKGSDEVNAESQLCEMEEGFYEVSDGDEADDIFGEDVEVGDDGDGDLQDLFSHLVDRSILDHGATSP